jgi:hypothetical protein
LPYYVKNEKEVLGAVVHAFNPSYSGSGGRRIIAQDQPGQKFETVSENKLKLKRLRHAWLKW